MHALSARRRLGALRALAAAILAGSLGSSIASPSVVDRITRAERLEDWPLVEKLARGYRFAAPSDLSVLTAALNACVARKCDERRLVEGLEGPLVSEQWREFARAWLEYNARDPAIARARFEALSRSRGGAWLGLVGRFSYAADSGNVTLLQEVLREAASSEAAKVLEDDILDAQIALAFMTHDYERIPSLLATPRRVEPRHLLDRFGYLLWKDDLDGAKQILRTYEKRFGADHDLAQAEMDLARLRLPPQEVVSLAKGKLKARPANWRVRLAMMTALLEAGDEERARATLASIRHFPTAFALVRLELATIRASFGALSEAQLGELEHELKPFTDFPEAHVAMANAYFQAGRAEIANRRLAVAESQNGASSSVLALRADIAEKEGRNTEAIRLRERVAELSPRDIGSQILLAYAYVKTGDLAAARRVVTFMRASPRYVDRERLETLEQIITSGSR